MSLGIDPVLCGVAIGLANRSALPIRKACRRGTRTRSLRPDVHWSWNHGLGDRTP